MKVKKGKLNYDQSGRAYPDNPRLDENWDCIWEYKDKYYRLIGDNEHKEWEEVNIYNQVIDEAYLNYSYSCIRETKKQEHEMKEKGGWLTLCLTPFFENKEEFINKIKTDPEFSEKWGLKIEGRELSLEERHQLALPIWKEKYGPLADMMVLTNVDNTPYKIPRKIITITYNNETIKSYE